MFFSIANYNLRNLEWSRIDLPVTSNFRFVIICCLVFVPVANTVLIVCDKYLHCSKLFNGDMSKQIFLHFDSKIESKTLTFGVFIPAILVCMLWCVKGRAVACTVWPTT